MNQILILCFFGQMLKDSSEYVAVGIYDCGWEDLNDMRLRKSILLALLRAQKVSKLTVFSIFTITLSQFQKVRT